MASTMVSWVTSRRYKIWDTVGASLSCKLIRRIRCGTPLSSISSLVVLRPARTAARMTEMLRNGRSATHSWLSCLENWASLMPLMASSRQPVMRPKAGFIYFTLRWWSKDTKASGLKLKITSSWAVRSRTIDWAICCSVTSRARPDTRVTLPFSSRDVIRPRYCIQRYAPFFALRRRVKTRASSLVLPCNAKTGASLG